MKRNDYRPVHGTIPEHSQLICLQIVLTLLMETSFVWGHGCFGDLWQTINLLSRKLYWGECLAIMRFVATKFNEFGLSCHRPIWGQPQFVYWHVACGKWHTLCTQKIVFCKQQQLSVAVGTNVEGAQGMPTNCSFISCRGWAYRRYRSTSIYVYMCKHIKLWWEHSRRR